MTDTATRPTTRQSTKTVTVDALQLRRCIRAVAPFASTDEMRPIVTGIHLRADDDGRLVVEATDSYTLAVATLADTEAPAGYDVNVDRDWLSRWSRIRRTTRPPQIVRIRYGASYATLVDEHLDETFTARRIEGGYPNVTRVMADHPEVLVDDPDAAFNPAYLKRCLTAAASWSPHAAIQFKSLPSTGPSMKPVEAHVQTADGHLALVIMPVRMP